MGFYKLSVYLYCFYIMGQKDMLVSLSATTSATFSVVMLSIVFSCILYGDIWLERVSATAAGAGACNMSLGTASRNSSSTLSWMSTLITLHFAVAWITVSVSRTFVPGSSVALELSVRTASWSVPHHSSRICLSGTSQYQFVQAQHPSCASNFPCLAVEQRLLQQRAFSTSLCWYRI